MGQFKVARRAVTAASCSLISFSNKPANRNAQMDASWPAEKARLTRKSQKINAKTLSIAIVLRTLNSCQPLLTKCPYSNLAHNLIRKCHARF